MLCIIRIKMIKEDFVFIFISFFIVLFHSSMINPNEKKIFQKIFGNNKIINRPECSSIDNQFKCFGFPSGHSEAAVLFFGLLYYKKIISAFFCILFIFLVGLQRIISYPIIGMYSRAFISFSFF